MKPMVSICCATYNHGRFIAKTLDSFLMQKTEFPIEILINDDASTDDTAKIIQEYTARHPDIIKPIYQTTNQYSQGVPIDPTFNYPRAQGKYIALCEGDDFWCDEQKLQRQVDYMQAHPNCTFCFTNGYIEDESGERAQRVFLPYSAKDQSGYFAAEHEYTVGEMCALNFVPTASFLFPTAVLSRLPATYWQKKCPHGDLKLRMFCTAAGYGVYLHAFTCVYRENVAGGAMSGWSREGSARAHSRVFDRAQSVAEMLSDVDEWSEKKYTEPIGRFRDWYLYVMLFNAPLREVLQNADVKRVYQALPIGKRWKLCLKELLKR